MIVVESLTERIDRDTAEISHIVHYMCGMRTHHTLGACALNAAQRAQRDMIKCVEKMRRAGLFSMEELADTTPYHFERD